MREILFRGKGMKDGEWHYGSLQIFKGYSVFDNIWNNFIPVWSKTVGQFTGLLDKNGKRIFEGDIVLDLYGRMHIVEMFFGRYVPFNMYPEYKCLNPDNCEVIGNIHDNPELVEQG